MVGAVPLVVFAISLRAIVLAISRSGFWADDFLYLTHFNHSLGSLTNDHVNVGKYVSNLFWGLGTTVFGRSSVAPYLVANAAVLATGVGLWLRAATSRGLTRNQAIWIVGLFVATGAWWPGAMWSSNITHSGAFLGLGAGALCAEQGLAARSGRATVLWMIASGAGWTFAAASNLAYIGVLVLAAWYVVLAARILTERGWGRAAIGALGLWNLLVPLLYFFLVALPSTTSFAPYSHSSLSRLGPNLSYYRAEFAPTFALQLMYVVIIAIALAGAAISARRRRWFGTVTIATAAAVAVPALVQGQQRALNYVAMTLLLLFTAATIGTSSLGVELANWRAKAAGREGVRAASPIVAIVAIVTILAMFAHEANVQHYFESTPYGGALKRTRSQVARLVPARARLCVRMDLDPAAQTLLIAEMNGANGFRVPPIDAVSVALTPAGLGCPSATASVTIAQDAAGNFVASSRPAGRAVASARVPTGAVTIRASPNPVPPGQRLGTTDITWSAPAGQVVIVRVSLDSGTPKLFAEVGGSGSESAGFIVPGHRYTFSVAYAAAPLRTVASVAVTRAP